MTRRISLALVLSLTALGALGMASSAQGGKEIFTASKCGGCHKISSQSVGTGAVDLAGVGKKHNAAWITKFLQKQETLNGAQHKVKFKGTDADLTTLATWLASLK